MFTETMIRVTANKKMAAFLKNEGLDYFKNDFNQFCITTVAYYLDSEHDVDSLIMKMLVLIGEDCIIEGDYDYPMILLLVQNLQGQPQTQVFPSTTKKHIPLNDIKVA